MSKMHEVMLFPLTLSQLKEQLIASNLRGNLTFWVEAQADWFEETGNPAIDRFPMGLIKWMERLMAEVREASAKAEYVETNSTPMGSGAAGRLHVKITSNFRVKKTFQGVYNGVTVDDYQVVLGYPDQRVNQREGKASTLPKPPTVTVLTNNRKAVITSELFEQFSADGTVCVDRWALALGPKGLYWAHAFHREGIYDDTTYCPAKAEDARVRTHGLIRKWAGMGDLPIDTAWKKFFWYCHTHPNIRGKMALPAQEALMRKILAHMETYPNPSDAETVVFAAWVIQQEIDMGVTALTTNVTKQGWGVDEVTRGEMTYEKYTAAFNVPSLTDSTQV